MNVDSVITLDNDMNCLLLDKVEFEGANYFLAVILDDKDQPTNKNVVLRESVENGETYVESVDDQRILENVIVLFTRSFNQKVDSLTVEDI